VSTQDARHKSQLRAAAQKNIPVVKLNNKFVGSVTSSIEKANEMREECLPNTKLELMHQIHNQHI